MYSQCPITSLLGNNIVCHGFCLFVYASVGWFARFHKNILLSLGLWQTITNSPPDLMTEIARLSCQDNAASWALEKHKFMFIYILLQLTFLTHEFLTSIYIFEKQRKREKEREQEWESERKKRESSLYSFIPQMTVTTRAGPTKNQEPGVSSGPPFECTGQRNWAIFYCFPKHLSGELDKK